MTFAIIRYDLTDNVFEPVVDSPLNMKFKCGMFHRSNPNINQPVDFMSQFTKQEPKVVSVSTDNIPGNTMIGYFSLNITQKYL